MNTPEEDPVFALQMSQTKAQFLGWAGAFPELKKKPHSFLHERKEWNNYTMDNNLMNALKKKNMWGT